MFQHAPHRSRRAGMTLLEVLVGLAILLAGLLALAAVVPTALHAHDKAELLTTAAMLAQAKAEEIRRDDSEDMALQNAIRDLTAPTDPIKFIQEPRLTYSFSGATMIYTGYYDETVANEEQDARSIPGVARVIIRYAADFRPTEDVIYELRF